MTSYSLVIPPPWQRIRLGPGMDADVDRVLERAVQDAPKDMPPDQVAAVRIRMREQLLKQLRAAREQGGEDFYFPPRPIHGIHLNASFVVSVVIPDARFGADDVAPVQAQLIANGGEPRTIKDTLWVRSTEVIETDGTEMVEAGLRARKIDYTTAIPGDERRWVVVAATVIGDGDPYSEHTEMVGALFDAMMTTWRWTQATTP